MRTTRAEWAEATCAESTGEPISRVSCGAARLRRHSEGRTVAAAEAAKRRGDSEGRVDQRGWWSLWLVGLAMVVHLVIPEKGGRRCVAEQPNGMKVQCFGVCQDLQDDRRNRDQSTLVGEERRLQLHAAEDWTVNVGSTCNTLLVTSSAQHSMFYRMLSYFDRI